MKIKSYITLALMTLAMAAHAQADRRTIVDGVSISDIAMNHNGDYMSVDMTMDLSALDVASNRAVLLTPRLVGGNDSVDLQSVGIYGRRRYYYYVRGGESVLTAGEQSYRASRVPDTIAYHCVTPYAEWMNGATLTLHRSDYGCCSTLLAEQDGQLARHMEDFFPTLVYALPQGDRQKIRSIEGSAYIDFVVNKTDIDPAYRRNATELGKIQATIDTVRGDNDVHITSVYLKGYASPESPYANNERLAIGRTDALRQYIQQMYDFRDSIITTDHEAEDWQGLRRYVEQSNIDNRTAILSLIDSDMDPDAKEWKLKSTYPEQYRFLLDNCYPALRHTDYRIAYVIRSYSDVEEIKRLMHTQPQKLSLNEFYLLAKEYEPGTDEFTEVYETAVRMYPTDPVANLNAANAAMRRGDNAAATRYLERAGDTPEAAYARGALAIRMKDYDTARQWLTQAADGGVTQAATTLDALNNGQR